MSDVRKPGAASSMTQPLLNVDNLNVEFETARGLAKAVDSVSFQLKPGETLGVVGESGSGKSVTSLAVMDLLAENAVVRADAIEYEGHDLSKMDSKQKRSFWGTEIAMIFQDPMSSLNPCFTVGFQLQESLQTHLNMSRDDARERSVDLLKQVGIPDPEHRLQAYPHQLSGGMSQRVMIAMAIAGSPKLLIADEPTTALDVTIQAQILDLLGDLKKQNNMAMILITHDIGLVAQQSDRILVMYAGQVVEVGDADEVIHDPNHPYTKGLLDSMPKMNSQVEFRSKLPAIPGVVPDLHSRPPGCQLVGRCTIEESRCSMQKPPLIESRGRFCRCIKPMSGANG